MVALESSPGLFRARALIAALVLFVIELGVIGTLFKHAISFSCLANWPERACQAASGSLVAIYCLLGAGVLFALLRPTALRELTAEAGTRLWPLALNLAGVGLALVPLVFLQNGAGTAVLLPAFGFWGLGMVLILVGMGLLLSPLPLWRRFLGAHGTTVLPMLAAGAAAPYLATLIRPIWQLETIAGITFSAVSWIVQGLGYEVDVDLRTKVIGAPGFYIDVAPQCSGVEGLALVTVFVTLYLWLFRADLRFPRVLWLYPIGLMVSALFNVLRIAGLLVIGLEGNANLAVGGFHSHAGWLMFTLIALGIVVAAQTVPALQRVHTGPEKAKTAPLPFLQDPVVARILPFAVFMLSALLASAFAQNPAVVYPLRVLAMGACLALVWPALRSLRWQVNPIAALAGIAVGVMWIAIPVEASEGPLPYGTLTGALLVGWFALRGIGTVVLVPVIGELFFRDYLESRLRLGQGALWHVLAAVGTAVLFAALHDRWAEAFVAGLVFSWVMGRRGQVVDAIIAHAAANIVVFAAAALTGNLAMI